jgi:anaerobic selenocysteine-containing dehydrogenase
VYFSPEIPGRRIGEARAEWEIFMQLAEHVRPEASSLIHFEDAAAIRAEIANVVPSYDGIQHLRKKGDVFQYGGPLLCEGGIFPMPEGRARFTPLTPPETDIPQGQYVLSTRRGKQFNSMIHEDVDPLLGASRSDVLMGKEDAAALGVQGGDEVIVSNAVGSYRGRVRLAPIRPRNVQIYWPEGNVLIRRGVLDPACEMPDYNAFVEIEAVRAPRVGA